MRRLISFAIIGIVFVCSFGVDLGGHSAKAVPVADDCDWPMFGRTPEGNRMAPDGCGPKTNNLELKWKWKEEIGPISTNLLDHNNKLYFGSYDGNIYCCKKEPFIKFWECKTGGAIYSESLSLSNDKLFCSSSDNSIYCISTENGKIIWKYTADRFDGFYGNPSCPISTSDNVYFRLSGNLYCLFIKTGKLSWIYKPEPGRFISSIPSLSNGIIFVGVAYNVNDQYLYRLYCLDAFKGKKICELDKGIQGISSDSVVISNNKLFFPSDYNKIYCFSMITKSKIWEYKTNGYIDISPSIANGKLYFGSRDNFIYCLSTDTGKLLWKSYTSGYESSCFSKYFSTPTVLGDKVYVGSQDKYLYCFSADSGNLIWKYNSGSLIWSTPLISNSKVYFSAENYKLFCLASDNGNYIWDYTTGAGITSSISASNSRLFFSSYNGKIYCVNANDGNIIWEYSTKDYIISTPAISKDHVYFGSFDNNFYSLNAANGQKMWEFNTAGDIWSSPSISNGKIYFGSSDGKLYCLSEENGQKVWMYNTNGSIYSSPIITNNKVYFWSNDGNYYCLNKDDGQLIWNFFTGDNSVKDQGSSTIVNGYVYFRSYYNRVLYCLNADTGKLVWEFKTLDTPSTTPVVFNENLYIIDNSYLYCLSTLNGNIIWKYKTNVQVLSSPIISNARIFFGSRDNIIYSISCNNGNLIWSFDTGSEIWSSPIVSNNNLYIGTLNGTVFCFSDIADSNDIDSINSISVLGHSIQNIVDTYKSKYTPSYKGDIFEINPAISNPYKIGKLKKEYLLEGLNELNFLRYLAGVPETKLDEVACEEAQYGALLLSIIKEMTHFPKCPEYVPKDICEKGYKACSSSNIYGGGSSHIREYVDGWIDDSTNVMGTDPGHRRWALFPYLTQTGFGQVDYTLMKAFGFNSSFEQDMSSYFGLVCWPAPGSFPKKHFNPYMTWSVSIDFDVVKLGWASKNDLSVTLARKSDNKKWIFNKSTPSQGKSYFYLSSIGYGTPYCINFRPNPDDLRTINDNESFSVNISGFKDNFNNNVDLSYEINLFDFDKALVSDIKYECTNSIKYMQFQIDSSNWNICGSQQPMMSTAPKIMNGRTFLVVKYIAESIGANIRWSEKEKKVSIYSPQRNITIHLWIGRNTAELNGKMVPIDSDNNKVVPLILNGRTMLPLRFISESLGLNVEWETATRRATIFFKPLIGNE